MRAADWPNRRFHLALFVAGSLALACAKSPPQNRPRSLQDWLICDECINGEREYIRGIGPNAVGTLASALRSPSPERIALMRAKLSDSYRFAHKPGADSDAYINPRLANYVATYQKRAALALADIGTDAARRALDQAISESAARGYRPDVVRTITLVRSRIGGAAFGGRITPGQLSFGDIVNVIAPPGQHFTAQDHAAIEDSPFRPDEIPFAQAGDTLRFIAVGDAGPHAIIVWNPGRTSGNRFGSITITSLLDATDRSALGCGPGDLVCAVTNAPRILDTAPLASDTLGRPRPICRMGGGACVVHLPRVTATRLPTSAALTTFLALSRVGARKDTVDFLKIEPPDSVRLTALLDWHGPASLDLAWRKCSPFVVIPYVTVTASANSDSSSVLIPAHDCWILQVSMGSGGDGPAFARLRIKTP